MFTWIGRYSIIAISVLALASCTHSTDKNQNQKLISENRPRRTILDVDPEMRERMIIRKTNAFMRTMADVLSDKQKEEVTILVREFFTSEQTINMNRAASQRMAGNDFPARLAASRKFRADIDNLAMDTRRKAKALMDKKVLKVFDRTMDRYLPAPPEPYYNDDPDWNWLDIHP